MLMNLHRRFTQQVIMKRLHTSYETTLLKCQKIAMLVYRQVQTFVYTASMKVSGKKYDKNRSIFRERREIFRNHSCCHFRWQVNTTVISERLRVLVKYKISSNEIQGTHKRIVRFQKLTRKLFLTLHGYNIHSQQRQLSKFLMRYQQFASHAYCGAAGSVSKMASQQVKAFCVLRFEVSRSVITVQREFRAL